MSNKFRLPQKVPSRQALLKALTGHRSPDFRRRMETATVAVAGLGGLGSTVAVALARTGIGTLILADFDVVETSNLNRQHYFVDQIGEPKTDAMAESLLRVNPFLKIIRHRVRLDETNIPRLFAPAGVIIECFDRADQKNMILGVIASSCPKAFFIGASGLAGYGESNSIRTWKAGEKIFFVGDMVNIPDAGRGLTASRVGIVALHQANLAVGLLVNPEATISSLPDLLEA